ncbi:MAG: hypothetical protein IJ347_08870 [Faecalibacterium sp.]|nr:hypothetical protein [Faecalibacterium sp.]
MTATQWLLFIFAALILCPAALYLYRKWDFRRQITGVRPERAYNQKHLPIRPEDAPNMDASEQFKAETHLKGHQNTFGPK